ncbi:MAG TPA: N-acetylmuramoyl-L-alanine amidase, partial [Verrucomicrobiae bacterium]
MRWLVSALVLVCAVIGAQAQASISRLPRTELYGHSYVRLEDWARAGNFSVRYTTGSPVVMVTNRWARLHFETDSRKCELDGITVHLSHPIAKRSGSAYITALDLQTAVQPVLFPPKNPPGKRIRTICLDAGHGGKDTGNVEGRLQEKNYTLRLAQEVRDVLTASGVKVVMTRSGDSFVELYDRPDIARRRGADLFVSLHFNSYGGASRDAKGSEVYCLTPAKASSTNARGEGAETGAMPGNKFDERNMLLAYQIQKRLQRDLDIEDRGVR